MYPLNCFGLSVKEAPPEYGIMIAGFGGGCAVYGRLLAKQLCFRVIRLRGILPMGRSSGAVPANAPW